VVEARKTVPSRLGRQRLALWEEVSVRTTIHVLIPKVVSAGSWFGKVERTQLCESREVDMAEGQ
jgi:hypothetical protein